MQSEQTVQPAHAKAAMSAVVAWVRGDAREAPCVRAASAEAARACALFFRSSAGFSATLMLSTSSEASLLLFSFGSFGSFDPAQPILLVRAAALRYHGKSCRAEEFLP